MTPLHPDLTDPVGAEASWGLAVPKAELSGAAADLGKIFTVQLASAADRAALEKALGDDKAGIVYHHPPALRHPLDAPPRGGGRGPDRDWSLKKCRFPEVWNHLDVGGAPGAIGIIDQGRDEGHEELKARITKTVPPVRGQPSNSRHAGAVAGVIAAIRGDAEKEKLKGCCSAELHLYNVWTLNGAFDPCAYYRALQAVAESPLPVVNLSIGGPERDLTEEKHVHACLERGVVLVAAIGNGGEDGPPVFPAKYDGVIAVGATTPGDARLAMSSTGSHMWLSAPGERIFTIEGGEEYDKKDGSSFAAPYVTAAVWLVRRKKPCLTVDEIRELLKRSVDPRTIPEGGRSPELGHGRLDMVRLMEELEKMRECP